MSLLPPPAPAPLIASFDVLPYAVPAFVLLIVAEMVWAARRAPEKYEPADTITSLAMGLGSTIIGAAVAGLIWLSATWLYDHRIYTLPNLWWVWVAAFVLDDFNYYWFHRSAHRVRWFWASHVNHHSSQHYNLSTALRQTWTGFFSLSFAFHIWPALIGFPPAMLLAVAGINLVYQFWIHTEAVGRMPAWFEAVFNTPSHHRVHHATNPRYLDRNHAGVFIIWDRLFGTYQPERDDDPVHYGIVRQLGSFALLHTAFHEWIAIAKDMWRAPWRYKLGYLLRPPGWSHDASRDTSDTIRERWLERVDAG
ncbi:sterol desaturase family protein [Novosphingobium sp. FKTRR1]|uniref:sterol desaturase family protein n=1 Tax=unclassified Novosphingobium TaxID=2644732 RepID=UPI001CF07DA9|nr:sterol desaturase family protein [Novosphingobium sp. FKTRR1]